MYSQRELICEGNPFTWLARQREPDSTMSQVGRGIKKGLGIAFDNPITRGVSELQKGLMPGAGRTRQQIKNVADRIFKTRYAKNSRFYRSYQARKRKEPQKYSKAVLPKKDEVKTQQKISDTILQKESLSPCKIKIKNKISTQFGLVDNVGNIVSIFYPFTRQQPDKNNQPKMGGDTGFIVQDTINKTQEIINQPLKTTSFVKEPNFVAL